MQQFWLTIEKIKKSSSYQFNNDHKMCYIDVDIFRKILDLSPKVENQEFTKPPSSDTLREFLLGTWLKGYIDKQFRNVCMYHEANVDYVAMIWEDLQYQIDYRQKKIKVHQQRRTLPSIWKTIRNTWITDEIKETEANQMYFKHSNGLIPLKKSKGRAVKVGKKTATTQNPTKPRKKPSKKKQVIHDESPEFKGEIENRHVSRKIRTPKVVVIKDSPSVPVKKTKESPGKLKGIEMLSEAAQLKLETRKEIKDIQRTSRLKHKTGSSSEGISVSPGVPDELIGVSAVSSEGVGTSPKVLDETVYYYEAQSDDDVWGSTDEETYKDKNEDDASEEEEDKEESVSEEENVDEENEEESDDDAKSFDSTNTDDERTESDSDDHEMPNKGETVAVTPPKIQQCSGIPHGVLLHNTQR
ncbi:hypothetical protein Tco_0774113 [Tanacetum coccineum]|uniref:Uncharacterized protein n=1 Tax=Tanacetum coccineum TaxID=301880 RepID=A0ABQ4ZQP1_9ASTR